MPQKDWSLDYGQLEFLWGEGGDATGGGGGAQGRGQERDSKGN